MGLRDISDDGRFVLFSSDSSNVLQEEVDDDCGRWNGEDGDAEFIPGQCLQLYVTDTVAGTTGARHRGPRREPGARGQPDGLAER